jgi:hypothetical protein
MRETLAQYRARTGRPYRPAAGGPALDDDAACPTLFRWPGAAALHEALTRGLARLGPPDAGTLWLCEAALAVAPGGAARFGALAVLEPLALGAAPARPGVWAADNTAVDAVVWIPPRLVAAGAAPWDAVATADAAAAVLGPGWDDERAAAVADLSDYLEELAELRAAGAPPPARPWCETGATERAQVLAVHGVRARFGR